MEAEVLLESSVEALHDLLRELLNKDLTTDGLDAIFKVSNSGLLPLKDLSCYLDVYRVIDHEILHTWKISPPISFPLLSPVLKL